MSKSVTASDGTETSPPLVSNGAGGFIPVSEGLRLRSKLDHALAGEVAEWSPNSITILVPILDDVTRVPDAFEAAPKPVLAAHTPDHPVDRDAELERLRPIMEAAKLGEIWVNGDKADVITNRYGFGCANFNEVVARCSTGELWQRRAIAIAEALKFIQGALAGRITPDRPVGDVPEDVRHLKEHLRLGVTLVEMDDEANNPGTDLYTWVHTANDLLARPAKETGEPAGGDASLYRVGRQVQRNIYRGDEPICMVGTAEIAADLVARLNATPTAPQPIPADGAPWIMEDTGGTVWVGTARPDGRKVDRVVYWTNLFDLTKEAAERARSDARLVVESVNAALARPSADAGVRDDAQIVAEVNDLARLMLGIQGTGYEAPEGFKFYEADRSNVRARRAWAHAVEAYELITKSEVSDALLAVEEDAALASPPDTADRGGDKKRPPPGLLMSMALRHDHGIAMAGRYDWLLFPGHGEREPGRHARMLASIMSGMRQLWEEVSGNGFYSSEKEAHYVDMAERCGVAFDDTGRPVIIAPMAPPATAADRLIRTDDTATAAVLDDLFSRDEDDEPLEAVISTHDGDWRREATDLWRFWKNDEDAIDADNEARRAALPANGEA